MKQRMLWLAGGFILAWGCSASAATVEEAWTARYAGPLGRGYAKFIKVDAGGNVYVSGISQGTNFWPDIVTVKYDANGNELWAARYDGPGNRYDEPFGMTIDSAGNVYVNGFSQPSSTNNDAVTIKYDTNGNQMWAALYDGPGHGHDQFNGVSVDGNGNVYVSGSSTDVGNTPSLTVIKYDARGNVLWVSRDNGPGGAQAIAEFLQRAAFGGNRRALLTTLDHACKSFDAGDVAGGVRDLQGFQSKVRVQVTRQDAQLATELIRQAQAIIDAVGG